MLSIKSTLATITVIVALTSSIRAEEATHHTLRYLTTSGYPQSMRTIAFSPDSSQLAFAVAGKLDFIDPNLGRVTGQHKSSPFSIAYSRDSSRIYMISEYESNLLDTLTGSKLPVRFDRTPGYVGLAIEEQSGKLLIQNLSTGGPASKAEGLQVGDEIVGCAEGRNGYMINVTGKRKQDLIEMLKGTAGTYVQLKVLPKGRFGEDSTRLFTLRRVPGTINGNSIVFMPLPEITITDQLAWCMSDGKHELRSAATGLPVSQFETIDINNVGLYAISPDQTKFAIIARSKVSGRPNAVEVFDIATQARVAFIPMTLKSYYDIAFCADNNRVLIATYDTIEVCDVTTSKLVGRLTLGWSPPEKKKERRGGGSPFSVVAAAAAELGISPSDSDRSPRQLVDKLAVSSRGIVATGDPFGMIKLWDLNSGELLEELPANPDEDVDALLFSPNGKWLVYFIEGVLHIVDVSGVEPLATVQPELNETTSPSLQEPQTIEQVSAASNESTPRTSKPAGNSPTRRTFQATNGATVTVAFDGAANDEDVVAALKEAQSSFNP